MTPTSPRKEEEEEEKEEETWSYRSSSSSKVEQHPVLERHEWPRSLKVPQKTAKNALQTSFLIKLLVGNDVIIKMKFVEAEWKGNPFRPTAVFDSATVHGDTATGTGDGRPKDADGGARVPVAVDGVLVDGVRGPADVFAFRRFTAHQQ